MEMIKRQTTKIELKPYAVISIYKNNERDTEYYLEYGLFNGNKISNFKPINPVIKHRLGNIFQIERHFLKGEITPFIISYNPDPLEISWRCEIPKVELRYKKDLGIENGIRPIPKLYFSFKNGSLYVKAYKEWKGKETVFYRAPFHNIYVDSGVCMGPALRKVKVLKNDDFESFTRRVQNLFFIVPGSEIHDIAYGNLNTLHKDLLTMDSFPESILKPFNREDEDE